MKDQYKTKQVLIQELDSLRQRIAKLERSESRRKRVEEKLRETEERFRDLYEKVPLAYQSLDENGHFLQVNRAWLNTLGYKREEVLGKNFSDFLHPDWVVCFKQNFQRFKATGEIWGVAFKMVKKEGSTILVAFNGKISRDDQGRFKQSHCIFYDITERRKAEKELQESEKKFRDIALSSGDWVWEVDSKGHYTYCSDRVQDILGYTVEEVLGKTPFEFMPEDEASRMRDIFMSISSRREPILDLENRNIHKNGREVILLTRGVPIIDAEGHLTGYRGMDKDVTMSRRTEAVLKRSEEFFRAISENASDIILIADKKGTITYASPSVEHILGYKQEELIGMRSLDIIVPDDVPRAIQDFGKAIFTKEVLVPNTFRVRHKDGSERVLEGVGKNLFKNPSVAGFVMNVRDVTDSRKAEEALLESEDRYRSIIENMLDVYYRTDKNGNIVMMSPSGASMLGYGSVGEMIGQNVAEVFYADPKERKKIISEIQDKGYVRDFEVTLKHREGTPIPVSTSSRLYFNEEGEVLGVEGVFKDIRERKKMENELRESEERYRTLIETTRALIYTTDRKGFLTYLNPTLERVLGYAHDEWNGKSFAQIVAPECIDVVRDIFGRALKGESIPVYEVDLFRKDGTTLSVEFNVTTLLDREGKPAGRYGIGRDITERKRAQEALQEAHRRLDDIIEFLPDATFVIDADSKVIAWNRAIEEMTGVPKAEMIGKGDYEYTMPFYGERRPILIDLALLPEAELEKRKYDITHRSADTICGEVYVPYTYGGKGAYLYGAASRLRDAAGNIVGAIESIRDITERKRAEAALLAAEELYRTLAESSQVSVYIVQDRKIVFANSHFSNYSGYEKENIMGRDVSSFVYPEDRERVRRKAIQLLKGESAIPYEYRIIDKSGRIRWLMETVSPITYQDRPATLGNTMDITELKRMEKELEDIRRTLIQSEKLAALGQLASGAAHEIRNPLNIMSLRMQMLEVTGKALDEDVRKAIDTCNTQIKRILRVLDGLYEFSRIPQTRKASNDLNKIMKEVIASQDKRFKDEGITPEIRYGENIPSFMLDKERITMVITHLISNAVDAMRGRDARQLRISTEKIPAKDKAGESVRLIVSDTGHGISETDRARIFDPFFTTKDPDKGKGLGLAISYGIIREHGGTIRVENNDEGGMSVFIDLPVGGSAAT